MNVTVRKAFRKELGWINDRYDEVGFKHSDFHRELIKRQDPQLLQEVGDLNSPSL